MIMYFSPLEQFTIISLIPFHLGNFYFFHLRIQLYFSSYQLALSYFYVH